LLQYFWRFWGLDNNFAGSLRRRRTDGGAEGRTVSELFREAFRVYRAQQIRAAFADLRLKTQAGGGEGLSEEELERFVEEDRGGVVSESTAPGLND
jgi:hypothetical protein